MSARLAVLVLAASLSLGAAAAAAPAAVVKLPAATQQRLALATAPLAAAAAPSASAGFATVLDPAPLATLDADIAGAAAAAAASQAEAARSQTLNAADQTVSRKTAEAAKALARADAAKLQLLRRRVGLEWGPGLAALSDGRRDRLVADIAAGRAALVRVDSLHGTTAGGGKVQLQLDGGAAFATLLGPTRTGDARLQSTGMLGLVRGPAALRLGAGVVVPARAEATGQPSGVVIPRTALLRTGGATYAYVRRDAGSSERRVVADGRATADGLFVSSGFQPGEPVVVKGAAQLFAAERPAQGEP